MESKNKKYSEAVGRRKTAIARVRITPGSKQSFSINDRELADFFPTSEMQAIVRGALETSGAEEKYSVSAKVQGGGIHAQAEAVRHGIARALSATEPNTKDALKKAGFLKRDSRAVERKKFGLKKARKGPTWSKR